MYIFYQKQERVTQNVLELASNCDHESITEPILQKHHFISTGVKSLVSELISALQKL